MEMNFYKVGDIVQCSGKEFIVKGFDFTYSYIDGTSHQETLYVLEDTKTGKRIDRYGQDMTLVSRFVPNKELKKSDQQILDEMFDDYNDLRSLDLFLNSIFKTPQVTEYSEQMNEIMKEINTRYKEEKKEN